MLFRVLEAIPASVTQLDLSNNDLWKRGSKLIKDLENIPNSITHLNLSSNNLGYRSADRLFQILTAIPLAVTFIDLGSNGIFIGKTFEERDALINSLQSINTHGRLCLENNGERALVRASVLLIGMKRNGIFNQRYVPLEIINEIAYWLGAPHKRFFNNNKLKKFTQQILTAESAHLERTQDSKVSESRFSFLTPHKPFQLEPLLFAVDEIALPKESDLNEHENLSSKR